MPSQNQLLSESMRTCFDKFQNYYELIFEQLQQVIVVLKNPDNKELVQSVFDNENMSNAQYRKHTNRVEWYICKQTPVANNLRFFIAILMSLKDLERCGDYVYEVVKLVNNEKIDTKTDASNEIIKIWQILLEKVNMMWVIFVENPKKLHEETFLRILKIKNEFNIEYKIFFRNINQSIIAQIDKTVFPHDISHIFVISVKIIRTIDHMFNIFKNFYLIDEPSLDISKTIESNIKSDI